MKIGIFTDCYFPNIGGAEIVVHHLAKTLCAMGHNAIVMAPNRAGLELLRLPYRLETYRSFNRLLTMKTVADAVALLRFQKHFRFDVINIHKAYTAYSAGKLRRWLSVPIVITAHGGDIQKFPEIGYGKCLAPRWEKRVRFAVQRADALVAISRESGDCFKALGACAKKIHYIANGVDLKRIRCKVPLNRQLLGLSEDNFLILAVGRYHKKKGYETLIRSMVAVKSQLPQARLLIVGRGMEHLRRLSENLGVGDHVIFVPQQSGETNDDTLTFPNNYLIALYQNSDVFVSPSITEGFALVCIEAMAAGLPLVLTACPGNEDVLERDGVGGYYVPVGDENKLADRIVEVLSDSGLRKKFSGFNAQYAKKHYALEKIADDYLSVFREAKSTPRTL